MTSRQDRVLTMPEINGVLETQLWVEDLERSLRFYQEVFGCQQIDGGPDRLIALSIEDRQVLLLAKKGASTDPTDLPGGTIPPIDGKGPTHLAFSISPDQLATWEEWLSEKDIEIESKISWMRGGTSLYFRDPDENLLELGTPGIWTIY